MRPRARMSALTRWLLPFPIGRHTRPVVAVVIIYCVLLYIVERLYAFKPQYSAGVGTFASSAVLGLLLGIHLNAAHNRWWEGRGLWGLLVNNSRNLALKVRAFVPAGEDERRQLALTLNGFADALRMHLRGSVKLQQVPGFETAAEQPGHVPLYLAGRVHAALARWLAEGKIDTQMVRSLDEHARSLMDVCGACEKIRNTPLPLSLRALLRHGIVIYLIVTPLYVMGELDLWGVPVMAVVAYFLAGMEALAEDVEEPFGVGPDNLDLDMYCWTITASVNEALV